MSSAPTSTKLVLEIEPTARSLPRRPYAQAKILVEQLAVFAADGDIDGSVGESAAQQRNDVDPILLRPCRRAELTSVPANCLKAGEHLLHRRSHPAYRERAAQDPELGRKSLNEIKEVWHRAALFGHEAGELAARRLDKR